MNESKIQGGYILLSRRIIESEIWKKPPLYLKVWVYLLSKAQHADYKKLKRGQLRTSIPEIMEACSWYIGYRKESPSYKEVRDVIDWLRNPTGIISRNPYDGRTTGNMEGNMIGTTKGTHGMLVEIVKYDYYQTPKNYEGHTEGQDEGSTTDERRARQGHNINKNDNNDNNNIYIPPPKDNKIKYAEFVSMTEEEYSKLVSQYGEESTKKMIEILDNYKGANGKKYKSDYRAILNWVVDRVTGNKQNASVTNSRVIKEDKDKCPVCRDSGWVVIDGKSIRCKCVGG